jgi:hypothetical protein
VKGDGLAMMTGEERDMVLRAHGGVGKYRLFCLRNRVQNWLFWHVAAQFRWPKEHDESLTELDDRVFELEQVVAGLAAIVEVAVARHGDADWVLRTAASDWLNLIRKQHEDVASCITPIPVGGAR